MQGNPNSVGHVPGISETGEPVWWYDWAGKLGVYPTPNASVSGNSVYVYYIKRPSTATLTSGVSVPAHFDKALTLYVVTQALYVDKRYDLGAYFENKYKEELALYRLDITMPDPTKEIIIRQK
jgi:hypothetical protein